MRIRYLVLMVIAAACDQPSSAPPATTAAPRPSASASSVLPQRSASAAAPAASFGTIDERTGLIIDEGFDTVAGTCTGCHSGRLIAQNRGTKADWEEMMRWMQKHHNLWKIERDKRKVILAYLAKNYGIDQSKHKLRRRPLPPHLMPPTAAELAQVKGRTP